MKIKKLIIVALLLLGTVSAFTGCRTAQGFGKDVENTGEAIQRGAE